MKTCNKYVSAKVIRIRYSPGEKKSRLDEADKQGRSTREKMLMNVRSRRKNKMKKQQKRPNNAKYVDEVILKEPLRW